MSETQSILDCKPAEIVDAALVQLQTMGIELVEWKALLMRRMDVPIILRDFSYLVPDEDVEAASKLLLDLGLPVTPPSTFTLQTEGDFQAKGHFYRITHATTPAIIQHMVIYPLSFSTILLSETQETFPYHLINPLCHTIRVPSPSNVYASILRMMSQYPRFCPTSTVLRSDFSMLMGHHMLTLKSGHVDECGDEKTLEVDQWAVDTIQRWSKDQEWRVGEEWMGSALLAVVDGTRDIGDLPCKE
ncbi:hypothetical protein AMATHDRAFT_7022 [Amanita thiersii Skay4041]|uniref:Uncharacterized protein n=1 Tax=Amanita thiersii Skay4041 TaxID=703135 RepID=A0A2A9NHJ2_9AGAR|nr:hypothetical protein AMATHDRAFT_7022 [Amanita thiersii Skay4041]